MIAPGQKLGRYHLREPLGSGGMSAVYRAYDPVLDREVALKILPPDLALDATFRERFQEEARTLGRVEHPNLVRIYAVGQEGSVSFYAMELIGGKTLREILRALRSVSVTEEMAIALQVLKGLDAAHRAGIIHRDIKPGNIMLDAAGRVILMDFGLARRSERQDLTAAGSVLGTPEYMSPEQARGRPADARSDLYSIGIILYELLGGHPPFSGKDTIAVLRHHVETTPPPLGPPAREIPAPLQALIMRLLAKNPAERYPHVGELVAALTPLAPAGFKPERVIQELLAKAAKSASQPTQTVIVTPPHAVQAAPAVGKPVQADRFERVRTWIAIVSAGVAVLALLVAVVALVRERTRPVIRESELTSVIRTAAAPAEPSATPGPAQTRFLPRPPAARNAPSVRWSVTEVGSPPWDGILVRIHKVGAELYYTFRLPGGESRDVPVHKLLSIEQKGGETR